MTKTVEPAPSWTITAADPLAAGYVRDWAQAGCRALVSQMAQTGKAYTPADLKPYSDAFALAIAMEQWRLANSAPGT